MRRAAVARRGFTAATSVFLVRARPLESHSLSRRLPNAQGKFGVLLPEARRPLSQFHPSGTEPHKLAFCNLI